MQVTINKKPYQILCEKEHEEQLSNAAELFNQRFEDLKKQCPSAGHELLLVMSALMLQHDFTEFRSSNHSDDTNEAISNALDSISTYVEKLSEEVK
jgi:cell division protein ZapA (FtsZ GTPase activity inhibitor)